jgi:hypothetical protein
MEASRKTPRLSAVVLSSTCWGLKCGLSGNLALFLATNRTGLKGNHQNGDILVPGWENLLDLSHNIYPAGGHLFSYLYCL